MLNRFWRRLTLAAAFMLAALAGAFVAPLFGCCPGAEMNTLGTYVIDPREMFLEISLQEGTAELTKDQLTVNYALTDGRTYSVVYVRRADAR